ncbi:MAG: S-layer family protein [Xenococcaceae cyanobacterium MO_188.B32]|nr:S-layer family protein [Xenococcaceae cyanobacterium MO_188.B32]
MVLSLPNFGRGNPGNIKITATESITLNRRSRGGGRLSGISSIVLSGAVGNGGNIQISTEDLSISNEAIIDTTTAGRGNGGKINITATNLSLTKGGDISASTLGRNANDITEGNAGDITLNVADTLNLSDSAGISNSNLGNVISDAEIANSILGNRIGNAGKIDITASKLFLSSGSQINSFTRGRGNAGSITINAADSVLLDGGTELEVATVISTGVEKGGVGNGGEIKINTNNLSVLNGAQIDNPTLGEGNAGNITINAREAIFLSGQDREGFPSGIFSSVQKTARGNGGKINITTENLALFEHAVISVGSLGQGNGGNIFIQANSFSLERDSALRAATSFGTGGNITLRIEDDLTLKDNSLISAQAINDADGGNLDIDTRFIVAFPAQNNDIIASAERGTGGKIDITAEALFGIEERSSTPTNQTNDIDASSQFGLSGTVNITQPDVNPTSGLLDLTQEVVNASDLIAQNVCTQTANSEFVDIGKGGLPQNPEYILVEDPIDVELVAPIITSGEEIKSITETEAVKPQKTLKPPAQGWIFHENGIVELVAYNPERVGDRRTRDNYRSCQLDRNS